VSTLVDETIADTMTIINDNNNSGPIIPGIMTTKYFFLRKKE
jgi:hypothetical protein